MREDEKLALVGDKKIPNRILFKRVMAYVPEGVITSPRLKKLEVLSSVVENIT